MSNYGYNDDDEGYGGHSSSSRSSGHTSSFNTTLLSNDGRFLGMKLSEDMASDFRKFYSIGLDWARRKGEQLGIPLAKKIAIALGSDKQKAHRIAGKAGDAIGYGIIFSNQLAGIGRNIYDSTRCLNELRVAVQPLAKAGSNDVAPLSGNNEVVCNARAKINSIFWQRLGETASSTIAVLPAMIFKLNEQSVINRQRKTLHAIEESGSDPDKVADLLKEQITGAEIHGFGGDVKSLEAGKKRLIERERKAYESHCEDFIKKRKKITQKKLSAALDKLNPTKFDRPLKELKEHGINTSRLIDRIEHVKDNAHSKDEANKQIKALIDEFKTRTRHDIGDYAHEALKAEYVRQEGAFDGNWQKYEDHGDDYDYRYGHSDRKPTIKQQIEENIQKIRDAQNKAHEEEKRTDGKGDEIGKMAAGLAAGLGSEFVTQKLIGKGQNKYNQPIALDRILHLRRKLEESKDNPPEQVPGIATEKGGTKDSGYVQYVHEIFQQHQKDSNRPEIGDRFTEHLDKARWDDTAIQQLPDEELTAYEYAVKTIAKRIKDGRMDAITLISLVGDKQKKIVRDDGRSFGPSGSGKDEAKVKEVIRKLIDDHSMMLHAGQKQSDDEINDKLGNFIFSVDDLRKALDSQNVDARERAFLFTVFSDVVGNDEKLCQMIGISNTRCKELRSECKDNYNFTIDGAVLVLAETLENNPDILSKLKLTDKEKQLITSLAERVKADGKNVIDLTENREEIKSLETVVANATMALGKDPTVKDESGKMLWTRIVEKAQTIPQIIKDHKAGALSASERETRRRGAAPEMEVGV